MNSNETVEETNIILHNFDWIHNQNKIYFLISNIMIFYSKGV